MSAVSITRRALVAGYGAVAVGATVAGGAAPALAAASPDAALFDLTARHAETVEEVVRLSAASDEAWRAALDAYPPRPDALRWRDGDFLRTSLGTGLSDRGEDEERWYRERAVGWMRDRPAAEWFRMLQPPLGPECEARRVEILAAWDAHATARRAVEDLVGYRALCEAEDAAATLVCDLATEIKHTRPATLAGLRALAGWFGRQAADGAAHDDALALFAATVAGFEVAA